MPTPAYKRALIVNPCFYKATPACWDTPKLKVHNCLQQQAQTHSFRRLHTLQWVLYILKLDCGRDRTRIVFLWLGYFLSLCFAEDCCWNKISLKFRGQFAVCAYVGVTWIQTANANGSLINNDAVTMAKLHNKTKKDERADTKLSRVEQSTKASTTQMPQAEQKVCHFVLFFQRNNYQQRSKKNMCVAVLLYTIYETDHWRITNAPPQAEYCF